LIAVDTNILVYAHRGDSPWHARAAELVRDLAESPEPWGIPWPCVHEFLAIVTHPRIYAPRSSLTRALAQVDAWLESPSIVVLSESLGYWRVLANVMRDSQVVGARTHDARIAALCLNHGIGELWSADRDFSRFARLRVHNPLVQPTEP
jgi:uncharacterized protein